MKTARILRNILSLSALAMIWAGASAQDYQQADNTEYYNIESSEMTVVTRPAMQRNGSYMTVGIGFDFAPLKLKSNQVAVFTPMIVNGTDTLELTSVGVFGRTRWYKFLRNGSRPLEGTEQISVRYKKNMEPVEYLQNIEYGEWMNGSTLLVRRDDYGCAGCNKGEVTSGELMAYTEESLQPPLIYQQAVAETLKVRELTGRAYVDFPVNKIVIYPDYRNNTYELGKIIATIDSVKNDPDITVTSIHIAGTASPEGPYDNNVYLAKNRTIALKEYVTNLYNFPKDFIQTDYEPVDWKGLREWLEANNLNHKSEILAIVNSDIEPYARNSKIKADYPEEYDWLLRNVYPALRHSDYRIEYTIRQFTNAAEIAEVLQTAPQKLSLSEIYVLADSYEPGSDEYNDVFETAARLFPEDETANLNAANAVMSRGDLVSAERYLAKAGNGSKAVYARGVLKALQGDYSESLQLLEQAKSMGLDDADAMIEKVISVTRFQ